MQKDIETSINNLKNIEKPRVSFGEISTVSGDFGFYLLIIFFCVPLCLPLANIPGIAQVLSVGLITLLTRLLIGKHTVWLPEKINRTEISKQNLNKICDAIIKYNGKIQKIMRERLLFLHSNFMQKILYVFCLLMTLILALPLVIPLTNFFPAMSILLINFGIMQRDGLVTLIGFIIGVIGLIFLAVVLYIAKDFILETFNL